MSQRINTTGAAAMAYSLAPGEAFILEEVRLHLDAACATSENFTITQDAKAGAAYDTLHFSQDMNTLTDLVWQPERPKRFIKTDELDFAFANTDTNTWGLEIVFRSQDG